MNRSCSFFHVLGSWVPEGITRAIRGMRFVAMREVVVRKVVVLPVLHRAIAVRKAVTTTRAMALLRKHA